ncbi:MAG TPA: metal ABC transporter substrate-binding protein [Candidatus Olsenella pullistercoris]|uniref:Lipoprotein n=1 Tax=Candidatus Olsenella pullistercoris TaxID=2838712 RepID=A0A9D2JF19_9ACTN|nr:metal ABC transporter substrate-binding protein [Candidatus Olsenella pullistercoris]
MPCVSRRFLLSAAALLATGALAACSGGPESGDAGSSEGGPTLRVGASPSPHAEILSDFAAPRLAERGITLEVREYTDYLLPNQDVTAGELDANYFQHINYLNNYNEENGTDLVSAGKVHFEPMGVFAGRSSDLGSVPDGATISVPNDATNEGRALLLLQEAGVIELSADAGLTATANDIADNPHSVRILEQEAAMLPSTLADVDFSVINGNYAIDAGLTLSDAVAAESAESDVIANEYANVIATTPELADDERVRALVEVLQTDDFKAYLEQTFGDAVQAAF